MLNIDIHIIFLNITNNLRFVVILTNIFLVDLLVSSIKMATNTFLVDSLISSIKVATNTNAKVYVELAKSTKDKLNIKDFDYPIQCSFKVYGCDPTTKKFVFIYHRNINIQHGALAGGINLNLNQLPHRRPQYRLELIVEDNKQMKFKGITTVTLKPNGTVNELNPTHLNYFLVETDD